MSGDKKSELKAHVKVVQVKAKIKKKQFEDTKGLICYFMKLFKSVHFNFFQIILITVNA